MFNSHLNQAQRERLAALESSESSDDNEANDEDVATRGRGGKTKPVRNPSCAGRPRRPSRLAGRRYNRPRSRGFPSGPSPGSWARTETPPKVRPGGDSAYKETQCQGACQSRDPGRITNLPRLNRVTYSLFIKGDTMAGQQHPPDSLGLQPGAGWP